jgi:ferredoxin
MESKVSISEKTIPVLYEHKEECSGCTACYAICPKGAISMQPDEEGFDYPHINEDLCIRCYMCLMVCPIKIAAKQDHIGVRPYEVPIK